MPVLARKVTRAKWEPAEALGPGELAADAVTDLRTRENALSFWRCESSQEADLERAALALAASFERADKIDLVGVDEHAISAAQLSTRSTPGETPIRALQSSHVDVERLDYVRLGRIAHLIADAVPTAHVRITKRRVLELLAEAVTAGELLLEQLQQKVRAEVEQQLERAAQR